ncbi:hypothetical protein ACFO1B_06490 [Dactylosporangium siamense]|uniref:LppX_LprAFG lipoprotein n=1 Tax=Dactylosporangium siamense TaxID=685454 RepID=A0A919U5L2_9ACTN|nr:hypothetical protein [Dactylosporangium siamense]GIG43404.1 hypothetical protein Dsi01nite_014450 [Dactylosporangium siamense]
MSIDLETQLAAGMHEHVTDLTVDGAAVLGRATRRHRRRVAVIRTGYALGVAGLAGVLAVGLTAGGTGGRATQDPPAVQAGAPASLRLQKAAAASDNISYRMKLTMTNPAGEVFNVYEGAFDPLTATGRVSNSRDDSVAVELLIDGTRYMGAEPPLAPLPPDKGPGEKYSRYGQYPGRYDRLSLFGENSLLSAAAPDPAVLVKALEQVNATITQAADGTLHFTYSTQHELDSTTNAGDVTLNADGRIAKVTLVSTWQTTAKGRLDTGTVHATLELSDYGLPVHVERPADVVPAN